MSSVEQLITPQYVYSNIIEHLRSQLNVGTLSSTALANLQIIEVEVAAFGTRYHFNVDYTRVEEEKASIIALATPVNPRSNPVSVTRTIIGYLEETLEPGAARPTFDYQARFSSED